MDSLFAQFDSYRYDDVKTSLIEIDKKHVWHPCTQMKDHEDFPIIPIKSGKGVWLYDTEGNKYLDAVSSWWVNISGQANPP